MSNTLECPCCGEDGAYSDAEGFFYDEQELACGCDGWVCVDEDDEPYIYIQEEPFYAPPTIR